jgi:hypothetical protein
MSVVENAKEQPLLLSSGAWSVAPAHSTIAFRGVFQTDREPTLALLYDGDRLDLGPWARSLTTTRKQGAQS